MELEDCVSFYHNPGNPSIEYCQNEEQSDYSALAERDELDSHGKEEKYSCRKYVYWPRQTHVNKVNPSSLLFDLFHWSNANGGVVPTG